MQSRLIRLIALVRRAKPRLDWGSSHFSSWRDGVSLQCQHLKEESHVEAHWEGPPPRLNQRSVKLTELWDHLPRSLRQHALQAAIRILKARVSLSNGEATHEDL